MKRCDLPPLNALRAFETAARLGSVGKAAAELHVTHGAISRQIRILEEALGKPLFARDGRGIAPTPAGLRLREAATDAFDPLRIAWNELRRTSSTGAWVLGCPGSILARWMIPRIERLGRELPGVKLHLAASESVPDAHLTDLDIALLIAAPPWPQTWAVHPLASEQIGPVLSPHHPDADSLRSAAAETLLGRDLLHTASRPDAWQDWGRQLGLDPRRLQMGTGFDHLYYLLEAAVAGLGIAIAPRQLVADDIAAGRLIAPWGFVRTGATWVLCERARAPNPGLGRLVAWLRAELEQPTQAPGRLLAARGRALAPGETGSGNR